MVVICTFKIKIGSQIWNIDVSKTSDHIQIKIKRQSTSQNFQHSSINTSDHIQININLIAQSKIQNQSQEPPAPKKPKISSFLQSSKSGFKGHGCSLHLQNQDREPKFRAFVYQKPLTISKSKSRCQPTVRSVQHTPKP